jgi:hypothetical protein
MASQRLVRPKIARMRKRALTMRENAILKRSQRLQSSFNRPYFLGTVHPSDPEDLSGVSARGRQARGDFFGRS